MPVVAKPFEEMSVAKLFEEMSDFRILTDHITTFKKEELVEEGGRMKDSAHFRIQLFGMNEKGERCTIDVDDFYPYFYVLVPDSCDEKWLEGFIFDLRRRVGTFRSQGILSGAYEYHHKFYGFEAGKKYKFVKLVFQNQQVRQNILNFWYEHPQEDSGEESSGGSEKEGLTAIEHTMNKSHKDDMEYRSSAKLLPGGWIYSKKNTFLYESHIPPLFRFYHETGVLPTGWLRVPTSKLQEFDEDKKHYHYCVSYHEIEPLPQKETQVPFITMSWDIEASSSHGDFPLPTKNYLKLASRILETPLPIGWTWKHKLRILYEQMWEGFFHTPPLIYIDNTNFTKTDFQECFYKWTQFHFKVSNSTLETKKQIFHHFIHQNAEEEAIEEAIEETIEEEIDEETIEETIIEFPEDIQIFINSIPEKKTSVVHLLGNKKEETLYKLIYSLDKYFPSVIGDKCTFIGSTFRREGEIEPFYKHCIVLGDCPPVDGAVVESYETEQEVLLAWTKLIQLQNPDILIGYNNFNFDFEFLYQRARELDCVEDFLKMSRSDPEEVCGKKKKNTINEDEEEDCDEWEWEIAKSKISLASGTFENTYIHTPGRIQMDLLNWFRKNENLESYKLDDVMAGNICDKVYDLIYDPITHQTKIKTKNKLGLFAESFVHFILTKYSPEYYENNKFRVVKLTEDGFEVSGKVEVDLTQHALSWGLSKDNVTPKDIFEMTNTYEGRGIVAKYCIQDCNGPQYLFLKRDMLSGMMEMANLCSVPINVLIFRGQGIKLTGLLAKKCREMGYLLPVLPKSSSVSYEGAVVLDPKTGIYTDTPVGNGDFNSLYPTSMISENICASTKIWTKIYDLSGNLIETKGNTEYDLAEQSYVDIKYDTFIYKRPHPKAKEQKILSGWKISRFSQTTIGVVPSLLKELLAKRKQIRANMKKITDPYHLNVLENRQLSCKLSANSVYGGFGASTSSFYEVDVAAATTATGRLLLTYAKRVLEEVFQEFLFTTSLPKYPEVRVHVTYIYGDTDSVFFDGGFRTLTGELITGIDAIHIFEEFATMATHVVSKFIKFPHNFEYEKCFCPLILSGKKNYKGMKYEIGKSPKLVAMGDINKRRGFCSLVKDIYGGACDIIMNSANNPNAFRDSIRFIHNKLTELCEERVPISKLILSKSLNSYYKSPPAHKYLADRITKRDPGSKPTSGERIRYLFYVPHNLNAKTKVCDMIETPEYIQENQLKINYSYYLTNQILNPLLKLYSLALDKLWLSMLPSKTYQQKHTELQNKMKSISDMPEEKQEEIIQDYKEEKIKELIFQSFIRILENKKNKTKSITSYFTPTHGAP